MNLEANDQMVERALRQGGETETNLAAFQGVRTSASASTGAFTADTRANRLSAVNVASGDQWFESDTNWLYYYATASWHYETGIYTGTDAQRSAITPTAADVGARFLVTDTTPKKLYEVSSASAWSLLCILLPVQGDAVTDYTDEIGGAVNNRLRDIPDPIDTPADADALRDDLVTNVLPLIRDALSSIASKENATRSELRQAGVLP